MSDNFGFFLAVGGLWVVIGLALSFVMGRRGHNGFGWLVVGAILGPLGVILAIDAWRHDEQLQPEALPGATAATEGPGPVDVLVGFDGSPQSSAAVQAVVDLFGSRLGRLTVATAVPYGGIREAERLATERLRLQAGRTPGWVPQLEVLHGHPSAALRQCAIEGGYELIAVGTRGSGITKAVLGSAASELAQESKVPVLLVGGQDQPRS